MGNLFTLASLREELENEFAPVVFEGAKHSYVLRSLLRVSTEARQIIMNKLKEMESLQSQEKEGNLNEAGIMDVVRTIILQVTTDGRGADLVSELGDDLMMHTTILQKWQEATQPGEAQDSPN